MGLYSVTGIGSSAKCV